MFSGHDGFPYISWDYIIYNNSDSKYCIGYTYNTDLNGYTGDQTDSIIKAYIDSWYEKNLKVYESYLSTEAIYCNDRSSEVAEENPNFIDDGLYFYYYPGHYRMAYPEPRPTYACPSTNASRYTVNPEVGNGYLTYPIALPTADELLYAGVGFGSENTISYMNDDSIAWWTMTPDNSYDTVTDVMKGGFVFSNYSKKIYNMLLVNTNLFRIRPVVSLKPNVVFSGGDGSEENPYIVE